MSRTSSGRPTSPAELGRDLPVHRVAPGEAVPGWTDTMTQPAAALDSYDSPIDMTEMAATYGITPTSLADFVHEFVERSRTPAG
jgi:hypothetical protein